MLVVAIDASRLTKEPAKIKGVLEVIFKNGSQPGAAAAVGGASNKVTRTPCPLDFLRPCAWFSTLQRMVIVLLEGQD